MFATEIQKGVSAKVDSLKLFLEMRLKNLCKSTNSAPWINYIIYAWNESYEKLNYSHIKYVIKVIIHQWSQLSSQQWKIAFISPNLCDNSH